MFELDLIITYKATTSIFMHRQGGGGGNFITGLTSVFLYKFVICFSKTSSQDEIRSLNDSKLLLLYAKIEIIKFTRVLKKCHNLPNLGHF